MTGRESFFVIYILLLCISLCTCKDCFKDSPCSCTFEDGSGTVDLTSLGNTDGTPRFKDVAGQNDGYFYSYNPCGGFDEEEACSGAALCMLSSDKSETMQLGSAKDTMFKYDVESDNVVAGYISRGVALQYSIIEMICDPDACEPKFVAIGRSSGQAAYTMQMKTVCACAGKCTESGPINCSTKSSGGAMSVGSIILIVLCACGVFYLVGGVLYMKVRKQASGSELMPNKELWKAFPSLIAGGFKYIFGKCASKRSGYASSN